MLMIKRYPNRKLYDTEKKQYITLDGIAEIIRQGKDVTVIDHATGEDLTTLTLTQIIVEQEKKQSGLLPRSVLASLIQAGGDRWSNFQRALAASQNFFKQFDDEIYRRVEELVKKGELSEKEGQNMLNKLLETSRSSLKTQTLSESTIERYLEKLHIPTHKDINTIAQQIEELEAKLIELTEEP